MDEIIPLVSVIIPAYNAEAFIQETVESVLAQTWKNKEIIVINDGSTDQTSQILERYTDQIRYIYQENRGRGAVRNTGIHLAKGDYLSFLDADDLWERNYLEVQVDHLRSKPEVGISYSWWSYIDRDGQLLPEGGIYKESGDLFDRLVLGNRFPLMAALVRRSVVTRVGEFDGKLLAMEDWDYWLRAAQAGHCFDYIPLDLVRYRFHGGNFTRNTMTMHEGQFRVLDKLYQNPGLPERILQLREQAYARIYLTTTANLFLSNQVEQAHDIFLTGVHIWPDLLIKEETYYTLICSMQPPGYRATRYYKDLNQAEVRIADLFDAIFKIPALSPEIKRLETQARARARLALARHWYLEGENKRARELIAKTAQLSLSTIVNSQAAGLWLRSMLGYERVQQLKRKSHLELR